MSPLPASYVTLHRSCRPCHPRLTATGKQRQTPQKKFPPSLSLRLLMLKAHICLKIFLGYKLWSKNQKLCQLSVYSLSILIFLKPVGMLQRAVKDRHQRNMQRVAIPKYCAFSRLVQF